MKLKVAKAPVAVSPIAAIERYIPVVDAKDAGESWEVEEYAARYPTIGCVQYDSKLPAHLLGEMDDRANEILKLFCTPTRSNYRTGAPTPTVSTGRTSSTSRRRRSARCARSAPVP